ncbi:MAG: hypothetical protein ABF296_05410 [Oceanococcaceae bacterium]
MATVAAWMLGLLLLSVLAGPELPWHRNWYRWDADSYEAIWASGYLAKPHLIAFPPLFSLLSGSLASLTTLPFHIAAMALNAACVLASTWLLTRIISAQFGLPAGFSVAALMTAPAAYFLLASYSDALFLYVFLHIMWLVGKNPRQLSRGEHVLLLLLLFCAPLVRVTGAVFVLLLLLGRWQALAAGAGGMVWMSLNHSLTGNALAFMEIQSLFGMPEGHLLDGARDAWQGLVSASAASLGDLGWWQRHLLPCLALGLALPLLLWLAWQRQWAWLIVITALILVSHNQAFWRSVVRYDLPLWPLLPLPWVALWQHWQADAPRRPLVLSLAPAALIAGLLLVGGVLQFINAQLFLRGGWTF